MKKVLLVVWMLVLTVFPFQYAVASNKAVDTWKGTLKSVDGNTEAEVSFRYEILDENEFVTVRGQIALTDAKQRVERSILYFRCNKQQKLCVVASYSPALGEAKHSVLFNTLAGYFYNNPAVVMSGLFGAATSTIMGSVHLRETMMPSVYAPELSSVSGETLERELEKASNMLPDRYGSTFYYSWGFFVVNDEIANAMKKDAIKNRSAIVSGIVSSERKFIEGNRGLSLVVESLRLPSFGKWFLGMLFTENKYGYDATQRIKTMFPPIQEVMVKVTKGLSDPDVQEDLKFFTRTDITLDTELETTCGKGTLREISEKIKRDAFNTGIREGSRWKETGITTRQARTCIDEASHKYLKRIAEALANFDCPKGSVSCFRQKTNDFYWANVNQFAKVIYSVVPEEKLSANCVSVTSEFILDGNTIIKRSDTFENICR